ncbi:hypothetical protein RFI_19550 [Reticulomyxa filosa]|uniref:Uncharacterized protein n=1 Tax=Reticulomyxa filosa TaxID=46433 RepID=X6MWA8_RETFI|nr:hypothetical protein RFI_19550 [Reticulomyxa filosa]|eukprot:ETO17767.1 hypothetical protein RFI_19550 [Reticulomyxa filosa]
MPFCFRNLKKDKKIRININYFKKAKYTTNDLREFFSYFDNSNYNFLCKNWQYCDIRTQITLTAVRIPQNAIFTFVDIYWLKEEEVTRSLTEQSFKLEQLHDCLQKRGGKRKNCLKKHSNPFDLYFIKLIS